MTFRARAAIIKRMVRRALIFALASASITASVAAPETAPASYANREFGLYFDVPAGWTLEAKPTVGVVTMRDSLGLIEVNVAAVILPQKKDVREYADKAEKEWGRAGKGVLVADLVASPAYPEKERDTLKPFLYDDTKASDAAAKKYKEDKAKRPANVGEGGSPDAIPDEPEFLAKITTRLYDDEKANRTSLVYYVIGGGVGYTVTVSAARADFFTALPMAEGAVKAMRLDRLSGGRYALPDAKALAAARMGIIMGKVLSNGTAVSGAAVNLYGTSDDRAKGVPSFTCRSNGYGEYTFTNLAPGRYYLLEVYGVSDAGQRVRSVQPITNIDVSGGRVTFVNVEVVSP